jgi:hypothetical protein
MKNIATIAIVATASIAFFLLLSLSLSKTEVYECNKWQDQAGEFPDFYLTQWQADQCAAHALSINAPVK